MGDERESKISGCEQKKGTDSIVMELEKEIILFFLVKLI